ncbi:MAG: pre-16S rRNA-processing nuclease YqgF [Armatimonadetes bacterium]|nr:pre-16S rRNA-processing nuclease YqgF [Armatimonadota bacterium]
MSQTGEKTVLAIDPGHAKCGLAVARRIADGEVELVWRKVSTAAELGAAINEAAEACPYSLVIVGSGTRSKEVVEQLREWMPSIGILVVDERDTSLQARERYWEHNPRRGWRRLLPSTMQVPPDPVDDFVALILAERVLAG